MKITFPHFGNTYIALKTLFDGLGIDYVIPPATNAAALELGSLHSPEEICLPFKLMIGNYLQSIEQGADTVLIPGSCGPCRFGEYCEVQMKLMKRIGHEMEFIVIDAPGAIGRKEFMRRVGRITENSNRSKGARIKALIDAYRVMKLLDEIEADARWLAGQERYTGGTKQLMLECRREAMDAKGAEQTIKVLQQFRERIQGVALEPNKKPLKIAIIGEIYTIIEPFSNLFLEDKLMDLGASSKRRLSPSWWVDDLVMSVVGLNSREIRTAAKEYLPYGIGGHAVECVGEAAVAGREQFDGAIQVYPLGCMPEIVSKALLPTISHDTGMPIMTLVVDEMTGETGFETRIEAFLDMLERRKNVLSWS